MTSDQFNALCRGTAQALGSSVDANALVAGEAVAVDGVKVGIFHREELDPTGIFCYVDLGAMEPGADAATAFENVLALNLELDGRLGETIGIERDSRHLVLRARFESEADDLHEGSLAEYLRGYAALANELYDRVLPGVQRPG